MLRKTFDMLAIVVGVGLAILLIAIGSVALWGYSYANNQVHSQLAAQKIVFPPKSAFTPAAMAASHGEVTPAMIPYLEKYAGQELTNGAQAKAYADHFIAIHLNEIGHGQTYAQLSTAARSLPTGSTAYKNAEATVQTVFQGTTLRSMLLEAYGFWQIGQFALIGSIIAYIAAFLLLVILVPMGLWHMRETADDTLLFVEEDTKKVAAAV